MSKSTLSAQQELGGVKLEDLQGPEALFEPGSKDGQTRMVRDGTKVSGIYELTRLGGGIIKLFFFF